MNVYTNNNLLTVYRKQCVSCGCARDYHSSLEEYHELVEQLKALTVCESPSEDAKMLDFKYVWYPLGVDCDTVRQQKHKEIMYNIISAGGKVHAVPS